MAEKKQAYNPFLPLDVYIPDGEPHVFGDRVYLFGSHDRENGTTFCGHNYEFWSAPVANLSDWSSKGINYSASEDPLSAKTNRHYLYAPDCVQGNDGLFYLYYCLSGERGKGGYFGPIGVAVCDTPDGVYRFHGHVRFPDGRLCTRFVPFDPAVINDDGIIRLYYGAWYPFGELPGILRPTMRRVQSGMFGKSADELKSEDGGVIGAVTCVLDDDMLIVVQPPKRILPTNTKGTPFESRFAIPAFADGRGMRGHGFFEASSIRKIGGLYYFIYSSVNNHELCYATSAYADKEFRYRGVVVSNGDAGFQGRAERDRLNHTATNHGSIENISGRWYVFYHRQTHGSDYSRQACAQPIEILPDGSIPQVEITTCGMHCSDLCGAGDYPAVICCNLTNGHMPHGGNTTFRNIPMVASNGRQRYLTGLQKGVRVGYKYFDLSSTHSIALTARGAGDIAVTDGNTVLAMLHIQSPQWEDCSSALPGGRIHSPIYLDILRGSVELLSFKLM